MNVERSDRKEYCLLLETKDKCIFLSLKNDEELYGWQDDIYCRLSLVGQPTQFRHLVHVGFDPNSGAFTVRVGSSLIWRINWLQLEFFLVWQGLPNGWDRLLPQSEEIEEETFRSWCTRGGELKEEEDLGAIRRLQVDDICRGNFISAITADTPIATST